MDNKLILILVDGMRPDALAACGNSYAAELLAAAPAFHPFQRPYYYKTTPDEKQSLSVRRSF